MERRVEDTIISDVMSQLTTDMERESVILIDSYKKFRVCTACILAKLKICAEASYPYIDLGYIL
jgi:hypothetical protein